MSIEEKAKDYVKDARKFNPADIFIGEDLQKAYVAGSVETQSSFEDELREKDLTIASMQEDIDDLQQRLVYLRLLLANKLK